MNIITKAVCQFRIGSPSSFFLGIFLVLAHSSHATLICPNQVSVNLDQCETFYEMNYNIVNWSSTVPLADTTFSPFPGVFLPPGNHNGLIIGTDFNGDNSSCSFIISVIQQPAMAICNDLVEVTLEDNCFEPITPEMILSPASNLCPGDALIQVSTQLGQVLGVGNPVPSSIDWIEQDLVIQISDLTSNSTCWTDLKVTAPTAFNMLCPSDITISCVEPSHPSTTGEPSIQTCFELTQIGLTYEDFTGQQLCPSPLSYITTRNWVATNPIGEKVNCQQKITGKRIALVEVVFPPNYDGVEEPVLDCVSGLTTSEVADTSITGIPMVGDYSAHQLDCEVSVTFTDTNIPLCGESFRIQRKWEVNDLCLNQKREHVQIIEIQDNKPPVFQIPDTVWVSSNSDCGNQANIPSATILEECSDISYQIQTPWSTIFTNGGNTLIQQNNGNFTITYTLTDGCGNIAVQTVPLIVNPQTLASCPGNVTIDCNQYFSELIGPLSSGNLSVLAQFGDAEFFSNCVPEISETVQLNVDECGIGFIERTIQTTNFSFPQSCVQQINVIHQSDFIVSFPPDKVVVCTTTPQDFGEPILTGADCEQIAVSFSDQISTNVSNACYKITRTWQVVNPCIYNPNFGNLVVESSEADLGGSNCDLDGNGLCSELTFQDGLNTSNFPNAQPDGYIEYQQTITVTDNFPSEFLPFTIDPICVTANNCGALINIPVPEVLDCSQVDIVVNSDFGNGFGPFVGVAPGVYNATFTAIDLCGNTTVIQRQIPVIDCQKPDAVCKPTLLVNLENTNPPSAEVLAFEVNGASSDNCDGNLTFSFSSNINDNSMSFDCNDQGINNFFLYVTDDAGNQDFCQGVIDIQDNSNLCPSGPGGGTISGEIVTTKNLGVGKVNVKFNTSGGIIDSVQTNDNGQFQVPVLSNITTITPEKDINILNGVTTFDIVVMQKHILFVETLDDPYLLIAADINNSGTITVSDAVALKKVILFIDDKFPNNTSWRFVDADFVFPNPNDPWETPFPEFVSVNSNQSALKADFVGIKIGDLNENVDPINFQKLDDRNFTNAMSFEIPNIQFEEDEIISVPFKIATSNVVGYQFTLQFDKQFLDYAGLINGASSQEDFGERFVDAGYLTASWNGEIKEAETEMFTLLFKAKSKGKLKDFIKLNSEFTPKEAYNRELETLDIQLDFKDKNNTNRFILYQNQPNPFSQTTTIHFYLQEDSNIEFVLYNSGGQLINSARNFHQKGHNRMEIKEKDLSGNGIYYFQIKTKDQVETCKIVLAK